MENVGFTANNRRMDRGQGKKIVVNQPIIVQPPKSDPPRTPTPVPSNQCQYCCQINCNCNKR